MQTTPPAGVNLRGSEDLVPNQLPAFSLHADHQTEEEIEALRAGRRTRGPSYVIMMQRADGTIDVARGTDGQPVRYYWERALAAAASHEEFRRQRERILGRSEVLVSPILRMAPFGGITP